MSPETREGDAYLEPRRKPPPFGEAVRFWVRLGCISFGGPAGQIAIMHDELVERRGWISERRFLHALSFCFALPGPEAQQLATFAGWRLHGTRGALAAGSLFVLPSFVLLCALSFVYVEFGDVAAVAGIVRGLGGAVVGLVAAALLRVGRRVVTNATAATIAATAFVLMVAGAPFPLVIGAAAVCGVVLRRIRPDALRGLGHGDDPGDDPGTAVPTPGRSRRRIVRILAIWLVPVGALILAGGVIAELAGFFTLASLVTFGGAYAVLPFVADQAVNRFHWLTSSDMVAGLALGETTPGPLIMVNTFVGYLAGWNAGDSHWWGFAGALVATFCTFAASFAFILIGAPLVDRMPREGTVPSALAGVSVAVVGAIAALGVFVGRQVLVVDGDPDWLAAALAIGAFVAMWRYRVNVVAIIGVCALTGLLSALA